MKQEKQFIADFVATLESSSNKLWGAHIQVPAIDAQYAKSHVITRVICQLNCQTSYQTALTAYKKGIIVVRVNKATMRKLALQIGSKVGVKLNVDRTMYGLPMPEEMQEFLDQDDETRQFFDKMTKGKQRTLLYMVGKYKTPEKRLHMAWTISTHIKARQGEIDYKQLASEYKNYVL